MIRKYLLIPVLLCVSFMAFGGSSCVTLTGNIPETGSPSLKLGFGSVSGSFSNYVSESADDIIQTKELKTIELAEDGEYYFALFTDNSVNFTDIQSDIEIEVITNPFILSGKTEEEATDRQKVEFKSGLYPVINKKSLSKDDSLINLETVAKDNKLTITYKRGVTKANLQLASFLIKWDGKTDLQRGWYKSLISVLYSKK